MNDKCNNNENNENNNDEKTSTISSRICVTRDESFDRKVILEHERYKGELKIEH